ncbi:hypothetical protein LINGRAHAP2_LOCUS16326 [Linum grandiflorum]
MPEAWLLFLHRNFEFWTSFSIGNDCRTLAFTFESLYIGFSMGNLW